MRVKVSVAVIIFFALAAFACKSKAPEIVFEPSKIVKGVDGGFVDNIGPAKASSSSAVVASGWAADSRKKEPAKSIVAVVDGKQIPVTPKMNLDREDVGKTFGSSSLNKAGWEAVFKADMLGKGKHKVEFYAVVDQNQFLPLYCKGETSTYCEIEVGE